MGRPERGKRARGPRRAAAALAVVVCILAADATALGAKKGFSKRDAPIHSGRLYDLGVSDYDRDGSFEVFGLNHKFLGTLIEGRPGAWRTLMGPTGFSPTPDYPGFEDLLHPPRITDPGLYIYAESLRGSGSDRDTPLVHIVARDVEGIPLLAEEAEGRVRLPSPDVKIRSRAGAEVTVRRTNRRTIVDFSIAERGHIVLEVRKIDLPPLEFEIEQAPLLARTFVGARKVRARGPEFTLELIDRHGVAWADLNRDGRTDAFLVRGGLGGGISDFPGLLRDELLVSDAGGAFTDVIGGSGLSKGSCRSRRANAIDYDLDGVLDLFSSCKGARPKLYRGRPDGSFRGVSRGLAKAAPTGSFYRWLDLLGNRRPELVVTSKRRVRVLRSFGKRRWRVVRSLRAHNSNALVHSAVPADFDRDGDADLWIGSPSGNTLLLNRRGNRLAARNPRRLGLPGRGSGSAWVDYDNDGRLDLHAMPHGLFRQRANGRFKRTRLLPAKRSSIWSIVSWYDYDADGYRDAVTATRKRGDRPRVKTRLWQNRRAGRHWLAVDLRGPAGNSEAIGAEVRVKGGGRKQTAWVGESDSSRFSQGHYRLYFGLGRAARAGKVTVRWPTGGRAKRLDVTADRVLRFAHGG